MRKLSSIPFGLSLLFCSVQSANAQQDDIYELITTAIHVQRSETALPVTVLNDEALHDAVRGTLGATLAMQPGINNASFGPAVGQTVIRGQQGRRVMNLSNGIPNADASGNSADHAQTVEAILATAIEVLRGPSTLLYGGGAIGGVVNVIDQRIASKALEQNNFALEARHDTAADMNTVVTGMNFSSGDVVWHLDAMQREWNDLNIPGSSIDPMFLAAEAEHEEDEEHEAAESTQGYIANTGGKTQAGTIGASWILSNGHIGLAVNRLNNHYGLPPGTHEHEEEPEDEHVEEEAGSDFIAIDMDRTRYDLNASWQGLATWAEELNYQLSYTDYEHREIEGNGETGTLFSNSSWQQRIGLTHTDTSMRHGVLGLQYSVEDFAAIGEESFVPQTDISSLGIFAVEDFHLGALTLEFGARASRDEYAVQNSNVMDKSFSTYSFSGSSLFDVSQALTVGLSLSHSQRAPSVEELYSNSGLSDLENCVIHFATSACEIGNENFKEETSANIDLTFYIDLGRVSATLTGFYNNFDDYIGVINTGLKVHDFPVREYRQDDARFYGVELDANIELNEIFSLRLFGDQSKGRFKTNGDVPRMPASRIGLELKGETERWSAYLSVLHAQAQDKPGLAELASASWKRIDMGVDFKLASAGNSELLLFVTGRNLGNEEIRLSTSYLRAFAPESGRSIETGLRYRY